MRGPSRGACLAGILVRLGMCRGGKPAIVKLPVTFHDFQSSHADFQLPYRVGLQEGLVRKRVDMYKILVLILSLRYTQGDLVKRLEAHSRNATTLPATTLYNANVPQYRRFTPAPLAFYRRPR